MVATSIMGAIPAIRDQFEVEIARTSEQIEEIFRLRYQIYCVERKYETGHFGLEEDKFDIHSRHIILRCRITGDAVGTLRFVLPLSDDMDEKTLPLQKICQAPLLLHVPIHSTAEVSRFSLSRIRRAVSGASSILLHLALIQGGVRLSSELGLTHWCAIMEPSLLRLLRASSIYFRPIGSLIEYHGLRQPAVADIGDTLSRMAHERSDLWNFITDGGRFWTQSATNCKHYVTADWAAPQEMA